MDKAYPIASVDAKQRKRGGDESKGGGSRPGRRTYLVLARTQGPSVYLDGVFVYRKTNEGLDDHHMRVDPILVRDGQLNSARDRAELAWHHIHAHVVNRIEHSAGEGPRRILDFKDGVELFYFGEARLRRGEPFLMPLTGLDNALIGPAARAASFGRSAMWRRGDDAFDGDWNLAGGAGRPVSRVVRNKLAGCRRLSGSVPSAVTMARINR
jgi:hypothetical protein